MADYAVSTAFTSKDGVTDKLNAMGRAADKFGREGKNAFDKAGNAGLSFSRLVGGILSANIIGRGVGYLKQGLLAVGKEFIAFDEAMIATGGKFNAARGTREFDKLSAAAREVGAATRFGALGAVAGLDLLAREGFTVNQAIAALPVVAKLATAANLDLAAATDMASHALGVFGLKSDNSAKLAANMTRVNDVFIKTTKTSKATLETLSEAMAKGGPTAVAAGADLETFSTLVAKTFQAGNAGATISAMYLRLQNPAKKAKEEIAGLGLKLTDSKGKLRNIVTIFEELKAKTAGMGKAKQSALFEDIFGRRAMPGVLMMLSEGKGEAEKFRDALYGAGGTAEATANRIDNTMGGKLRILKSNLMEMGFKFIDLFQEKFPGAVDKAFAAIKKIDAEAIMKEVKNIAIVFDETWKAVDKVLPVILSLTGALVAYKVVTTGIAAYQWYVSLAAAMQAAAGAQGLLNVAMAANPIGMTITAIGLLIGAGWMLYNQWDNIKILFKSLKIDAVRAWAGAKEAFTGLADDIGSIWKVTVDKIAGAWGWLGDKFNRFIDDILNGYALIGIGKGAPQRSAPGIGKTSIEESTDGESARIPPNRVDTQINQSRYEGSLIIRDETGRAKLQSRSIGAPPIEVNMSGPNE
jgi:TP901 family phage tail tape measure protein